MCAVWLCVCAGLLQMRRDLRMISANVRVRVCDSLRVCALRLSFACACARSYAGNKG